MHQPLPAHQTKHLPTLTYPFNGCTFHLHQSSDGTSNGTALWLGAQVLSAYAASTIRPGRLKAVELGSGIGLTACVLHRPRITPLSLKNGLRHLIKCAHRLLITSVDAHSTLIKTLGGPSYPIQPRIVLSRLRRPRHRHGPRLRFYPQTQHCCKFTPYAGQ